MEEDHYTSGKEEGKKENRRRRITDGDQDGTLRLGKMERSSRRA